MTEEIKEAKGFINLGVILNAAGEVMVIRRVKEEPGKEGSVLKWAFPGGKQHLDETREQCVKREVMDETGYDIKPIQQISLRLHPQIKIMIAYHLCQLNNQKPLAEGHEPEEVAEIKWVKPEELEKLFTTNLDSDVKKALGLSK